MSPNRPGLSCATAISTCVVALAVATSIHAQSNGPRRPPIEELMETRFSRRLQSLRSLSCLHEKAAVAANLFEIRRILSPTQEELLAFDGLLIQIVEKLESELPPSDNEQEHPSQGEGGVIPLPDHDRKKKLLRPIVAVTSEAKLIKAALQRTKRVREVLKLDLDVMAGHASAFPSRMRDRAKRLINDYYSWQTKVDEFQSVPPDVSDAALHLPSDLILLVGECLCMIAHLDVSMPQEQEIAAQVMNGTISDEVRIYLFEFVANNSKNKLTSEQFLTKRVVEVYQDLLARTY